MTRANQFMRQEREREREEKKLKLNKQFSSLARRALERSRSLKSDPERQAGEEDTFASSEEPLLAEQKDAVSSGGFALEDDEEQGNVPFFNRDEGAREARESETTPRGSRRHGPPRWYDMTRDVSGVYNVLTSSYVNALLVLVPLGFVSNSYFPAVYTFWINFGAIVPLAWILGQVTEDVAFFLGDVVGGLVNATLGNVVEIIIAIAALRRDMITIIQGSLLGSILSNMLLVLGLCFFFGGIRNGRQFFDKNMVANFCPILFLASIGVIMPTVFATFERHGSDDGSAESKVVHVSNATAIILCIMYAVYLFHELKDHFSLPWARQEKSQPPLKAQGSDGVDYLSTDSNGHLGLGGGGYSSDEEDDGDFGLSVREAAEMDCVNEEDLPEMSMISSLLFLTIVTVLVAFCSEFLTESIAGVSDALHLSSDFIGIILLPIVGNAAEHITAVSVAMKNKVDLAIAVCLGSSIQIALFAVPLMVILGWTMDVSPRPMTLDFNAMNAITFVLGVLLVIFIVQNGSSNFMHGSLLLGCYCIIGVGYAYSS